MNDDFKTSATMVLTMFPMLTGANGPRDNPKPWRICVFPEHAKNIKDHNGNIGLEVTGHVVLESHDGKKQETFPFVAGPYHNGPLDGLVTAHKNKHFVQYRVGKINHQPDNEWCVGPICINVHGKKEQAKFFIPLDHETDYKGHLIVTDRDSLGIHPVYVAKNAPSEKTEGCIGITDRKKNGKHGKDEHLTLKFEHLWDDLERATQAPKTLTLYPLYSPDLLKHVTPHKSGKGR